MKKVIFTSLFVLSIFIFSCGDSSRSNTANQSTSNAGSILSAGSSSSNLPSEGVVNSLSLTIWSVSIGNDLEDLKQNAKITLFEENKNTDFILRVGSFTQTAKGEPIPSINTKLVAPISGGNFIIVLTYNKKLESGNGIKYFTVKQTVALKEIATFQAKYSLYEKLLRQKFKNDLLQYKTIKGKIFVTNITSLPTAINADENHKVNIEITVTQEVAKTGVPA